MAGVVTAVELDHRVDTTAEQVGGLALALVTPLGAEQNDRRHRTPCSSRERSSSRGAAHLHPTKSLCDFAGTPLLGPHATLRCSLLASRLAFAVDVLLSLGTSWRDSGRMTAPTKITLDESEL